MAIKVSIPSSGSSVRLGTTVTTGSKRVTSANVEQLNNVDTTTNGLEDGFTIVYDVETGKWVTQAISAVADISSLDGGTY